MKRLLLLLITGSGATLLGACSGGEVIVQAERVAAATDEASADQPIALKDLTIRLLPYDRDAVFDSLEAAHPEPEPEIPESLIQLQDEVAAAQSEWKDAEARWSVVRDSLAKLSETLQGMSRAQAQYAVLYKDFQELEPIEQQQKKRMDAAFARFTELQSQMVAQAEEIRLKREQWADEAFASVDEVILARLKELKRPELADTTDATGVARFKPQPGRWWVVARYELPYQELYWNIPIDVKRGEPVQIKLDPQNAEIRRKL